MRLKIFCLLNLFVSFVVAEPLKLAVQAESAILINGHTGAILYEKQAYKRLYPASVTKIATALYALKVKGHAFNEQMREQVLVQPEALVSILEEKKSKTKYAVPAYWLTPDGTHVGLKKGEELSWQDLLYGLLLASGNDAANVIAQEIGGGSISEFMHQLNEYLKEIGCCQTTYFNPHGLFYPEHQTTAYDLAWMTKEALKIPLFQQIVASTSYTKAKTNKQGETTFIQTNKLLRKGSYYYERAIGVKTGYISKAGHTFVAAAQKGERLLIAVLLNSKERPAMFLDAKELFEIAFNQTLAKRTFLKKGRQKFIFPSVEARIPIKTYLANEVALSYYPAEEPEVKCLLNWHPCILPIIKDQIVGDIAIQSLDGKLIMTAPLLAVETVKAKWWIEVKNLASNFWTSYLLTAFIALLLIAIVGWHYWKNW